jgi:hypothetical protein
MHQASGDEPVTKLAMFLLMCMLYLILQGPQLVRCMLDSCSVMLLALHQLLADNHHIASSITQVNT